VTTVNALKEVAVLTALEECVDLRSGKTPARNRPEYWSGAMPWFSAKDLKSFQLEDSEEHISDAAVADGAPIAAIGDILMLVRGMTLMKDVPVGVLSRAASFNQDLKSLRPVDGISSVYLGYMLAASRPRLMAMVERAGHGTGRLAVERLLCLPVWKPDAETQEFIETILQRHDKVLQLSQDLISAKRIYKRGLMHQLLTGQMRFREFRKSSWKSSRLGDHVSGVTRRNASGSTLALTASGEHGLVDQRRYFNRNVAGADLSRYWLLKKGEFAYNRSAMKGYPYGATKRLDAHDEGVLSTLYLCFAIMDPRLNSNYLQHVFDSGVLNRQLRPIVRVGARAHGLLNVSDEDYFSINIPFPRIEEQRRIADVLEALNSELDLIAALQGRIEVQKRALLARLLNGELSVPASS